MLILNRGLNRLYQPTWMRCSTQALAESSKPVKKKNKNYVLQPDGKPAPSDPLYEDLVYSTEVDVYISTKRGKAFHAIEAAKMYQAENDRAVRERAAMIKPVPLALQYLYDGSKIQNEDTVVQNELIDAVEEISGKLEPGNVSLPPVFPYGMYDPVDFNESESETRNKVESSVSNESESDTLNMEESSVSDEDDSRKQRRRGRGRRQKIREERSDNDPVEDQEKVDYDTINDRGHSKEIRQLFTEDHLFKYGTANPDLPGARTEIPCGGCGAPLHCTDEKIPGFVPSQILSSRSQRELRSVLCQRCYFIKEYKVALKLNVSPEDYPKTFAHIKDKKALVLLVVDLLDFPGSVWPGILEILGKNKKVILVGNKFDLLVPDTKNYYRHISNVLRTKFLEKCWSEVTENSCFPQIIGTCCISAITGYNVEKMVEMVFNYWKNHHDALPGDIYIVGCTNVGKSSLFNTLLDSDLCKIHAVNKVENATISPVPGTTLNLLKFPVTRPEPHFLANRRSRLQVADNLFRKLEVDRLKMLSDEKDFLLSVPSHYTIKHTLLDKVKSGGDKDSDDKMYSNAIDLARVSGLSAKERLDPDERSWGKHCHDTPGTVSEDQIINLLTAEEISRVLPQRPLRPRTFLLKQGHSLLLGGLARLDVLKVHKEMHPLRVTVFCSEELPVNIVHIQSVNDFLEVALNRNFLKVPENKRKDFPEMVGRELTVKGVYGSGMEKVDSGSWKGAADIVLSSAGWIMVSPKSQEEAVLMAWTPGGRGIDMRESFMPNSVNYRGRRIPGTPAFQNDRVYQPLNSY